MIPPGSPPPGPAGGPDVEQIKARSRARHLQRIKDVHEKAQLCRDQYDEQLAKHGEVGRELHGELMTAAFRLHDQIHVYRDEDIVESVDHIFPAVKSAKKKMVEFDGHVADHPELTAKRLAAYIDGLSAAAQKLGFVDRELTQ